MSIIKKIKNYFEDRYILKTFKNASLDIKQSDLEFDELLYKYDFKSKFHSKVLTYSILTAVCEFEDGSDLEILKKVLKQNISYMDSLNGYDNVKNLELLKLKTELAFTKFKQYELKNNFNFALITSENEFSPTEFSEENFVKAINCTHSLTENNKKYGYSYCKSYKTLEFTKSSIELAFDYLLDCIKFDKNCSIYNNNNFADELRGLHMAMLLTYVNDEFDEIPEDKFKQVKFNSERKINIGENQIEITKLIKWRNKEQWEYFLNSFGEESDLGKICLEKINNNLN